MTFHKRWRYNRKQRLQTAPEWIKNYAGPDIVKSYRRWYRIDRICALIELKLCGVAISDEKIEAARKDAERVNAVHQKQKAAKAEKAAILLSNNRGHYILRASCFSTNRAEPACTLNRFPLWLIG
jgi:hypothetical protein